MYQRTSAGNHHAFFMHDFRTGRTQIDNQRPVGDVRGRQDMPLTDREVTFQSFQRTAFNSPLDRNSRSCRAEPWHFPFEERQ